MKPENKVVSLETAKRLKAAGFPQDTERWWSTGTYPEHSSDGGKFHASLCYRNEHFKYQKSLADRFAAPDAQEIGELFPRNLGSELFMQLRKSGWLVRVDGHEVLHENEAEARASVWLYLKENKLI